MSHSSSKIVQHEQRGSPSKFHIWGSLYMQYMLCVCVWNFSREVKLVPALPWQYFGNIWIYSVELLLPLVFRMSICLFFLCLLEKFYPFCSTISAGGWSMTQKSPTNEDASEVIVIWFWDAGITYLLLLIWHGDQRMFGYFLGSSCWKSCCFESAWNNHYHELGTERAISLIQVCILWWMSDKVPQGQGFDPEQPLPRGKHDWEKLNVEFTIFNLVIRLSNLPRVLLICQPFQMCISRVVVVEWWFSPIVSSFSTLSCHLGFWNLLDDCRVEPPCWKLSLNSSSCSSDRWTMGQTDGERCQVYRWFSFFLVFGEV